ncbi:unnamed protein product, partial [Strongylus vulgaris]
KILINAFFHLGIGAIDEQQQADETGVEKRKHEYLRFGKRKHEYLRFGKRKHEYLRYTGHYVTSLFFVLKNPFCSGLERESTNIFVLDVSRRVATNGRRLNTDFFCTYLLLSQLRA